MTVHNDKSSLLDSLKIERTPVQRKKTSPLLYGAAAVALLAVAAGGWFFWPDNAIPIHVITASSDGAGGGGKTRKRGCDVVDLADFHRPRSTKRRDRKAHRDAMIADTFDDAAGQLASLDPDPVSARLGADPERGEPARHGGDPI